MQKGKLYDMELTISNVYALFPAINKVESHKEDVEKENTSSCIMYTGNNRLGWNPLCISNT